MSSLLAACGCRHWMWVRHRAAANIVLFGSRSGHPMSGAQKNGSGSPAAGESPPSVRSPECRSPERPARPAGVPVGAALHARAGTVPFVPSALAIDCMLRRANGGWAGGRDRAGRVAGSGPGSFHSRRYTPALNCCPRRPRYCFRASKWSLAALCRLPRSRH